MMLMSLRHVSKVFTMPDGHPRTILSQINLTLGAEEIVALLGSNGTGKTTLAGIVAGIDECFEGSISRAPGLEQRSPMIFQDYRASLLPWMSIADNICFPLTLRGVSKRERLSKLESLLAKVPSRFSLDTPTRRLSGGQSQLVSILRALIVEPKLVVCDEPFSALDYNARLLLRGFLERSCRDAGIGALFISHSIEDAVLLADRIVVLRDTPSTIISEFIINSRRPRASDWLESAEAIGIRKNLRELFISMG